MNHNIVIVGDKEYQAVKVSDGLSNHCSACSFAIGGGCNIDSKQGDCVDTFREDKTMVIYKPRYTPTNAQLKQYVTNKEL